MEEQALQQLSKDVAEKYGIEPIKMIIEERIVSDLKTGFTHGCCGKPLSTGECCGNAIPEPYEYMEQHADIFNTEIWLHQDSARCFDLLTTHRINVFSDDTSAWAVHKNQHLGFLDYLSDYSNNVPMACRVVGLKALLVKDKT